MSDIPKKMKALVTRGPNDMTLETIPVPVPAAGEALLKVEACGICAGDPKIYYGIDMGVWGTETQPGFVRPPFTPGHEFFGRIVRAGDGFDPDFKVGDRVAVEQVLPCGHCRFCKDGHYWMCKENTLFGFRKDANGGMAEYVLLPKESRLYKIPEDMSVSKAALIEPFGCSKHAVDNAHIENEDVVVMSGAGTLGLGMIGTIKQKNPKTLIVLDFKPERLALAKKFGADITLNPGEVDVVQEVQNLTDGYGCDVYIEATGHPSSVIQGLNMIRNLGKFVEFSVFGMETSVDWTIIGNNKELTIYGAHLSPYCFDTVIDWLNNGKLPSDGVVTHLKKLEDYEEAFRLAKTGDDNSIKVVLVP
ncbi:MAG: alcohol dehydrogenase catalytic domain-containing protein [Clostridiales Family XIII bacterium]|jgi:2-desacetyl-2-hydroxyethyl bacteriochlorophyllide A dehydrogenase|nr:alcohol dehydrogenase catalytic domain-containing protein [Clostridiales Family XIII bacterium]